MAELIVQARDLWGNPPTMATPTLLTLTAGHLWRLWRLWRLLTSCLCVRVAGLPCECRLPSLEYSRSGAGAEDLEEHDAFNITLTLISQFRLVFFLCHLIGFQSLGSAHVRGSPFRDFRVSVAAGEAVGTACFALGEAVLCAYV